MRVIRRPLTLLTLSSRTLCGSPGLPASVVLNTKGSLYFDAFRKLRAVPPEEEDCHDHVTVGNPKLGSRTNPSCQERFRSVLQEIKRRNANMLFHVMRPSLLNTVLAAECKPDETWQRGVRTMRTKDALTEEQAPGFSKDSPKRKLEDA